MSPKNCVYLWLTERQSPASHLAEIERFAKGITKLVDSFFSISYKDLSHFLEPFYPPIGRNQGEIDLLQTGFRELVFELVVEIMSTFKLNNDENEIYFFLNQIEKYKEKASLKFQAVELHKKLSSLLLKVFKNKNDRKKKETNESFNQAPKDDEEYLRQELPKILSEYQLSDKLDSFLSLSLIILNLISNSKKIKKLNGLPKDEQLKELLGIEDQGLQFLKQYCLEFFLPILENQFSKGFTKQDVREAIDKHLERPYSFNLEELFFHSQEKKVFKYLKEKCTIDNFMNHLKSVQWLEQEDTIRLRKSFGIWLLEQKKKEIKSRETARKLQEELKKQEEEEELENKKLEIFRELDNIF